MRKLKVLEGQVEVGGGKAVLSITNGKAQLVAHLLDPAPDVRGDKKAIGKYRLRPGLKAGVSFRKGEEFGLDGCDLPKGLRAQVEILEGPPWDPPAPPPGPAAAEGGSVVKPDELGLEAGKAPPPGPAAEPVVTPKGASPKHSIGRKG